MTPDSRDLPLIWDTTHEPSAFDPSHFSRRELRILEQLADEFRETDADDMIEATHLERSPWHRVWVVQGGRQQQIPYHLALRQDDAELVQQAIDEREQVLRTIAS